MVIIPTRTSSSLNLQDLVLLKQLLTFMTKLKGLLEMDME